MVFGLDEKEKQLKDLLNRFGCEETVFKNFKSNYQKIDRRMSAMKMRYEKSYEMAQRVLEIAQLMEQFFVDGVSVDLNACARELKEYQGKFDHEFLISSQDREFHSTYDTLVRKIPLFVKGKENPLMMQSEVENLIQILQENLRREAPNHHAVAYFIADHKVDELYDLSPDKKREFVYQKLVNEVVMPLQKAVKASQFMHPSDTEQFRADYERLGQLVEQMVGVKA